MALQPAVSSEGNVLGHDQEKRIYENQCCQRDVPARERVILGPKEVAEIVRHGHTVMVEKTPESASTIRIEITRTPARSLLKTDSRCIATLTWS